MNSTEEHDEYAKGAADWLRAGEYSVVCKSFEHASIIADKVRAMGLRDIKVQRARTGGQPWCITTTH